MNWRRYLTHWTIGLVALCALAGVLNSAIDPYGLLGTPELPSLNSAKPAATTRTRIVKPVQGERAEPTTLVLGNSRPEMGLDPESDVWRSTDRPVYNAGIPGAGTYMVMRYGQDIISDGHTKLVLWGLDFADFLNTGEQLSKQCQWPPPVEEWEHRLRVTESMEPMHNWRLQRLKDYGTAMLSTEALVDSLATIVAQGHSGRGTRTPLGFNPARDYPPIIHAEGQHVLFAQKNAEMTSRLLGRSLSLVSDECEMPVDFRSVSEFLKLAQRRDIKVILFINPYHKDYLGIIWQAGLWPLFDDWKRRLYNIAAEGRARALWDFSLLDDYTTEDAPPPSDRTSTLRWFWEPAHYKAELGNLMLRQMLGSGDDSPDRVGANLHAETLNDHLARQRQLAKTWFGTSAPTH